MCVIIYRDISESSSSLFLVERDYKNAIKTAKEIRRPVLIFEAPPEWFPALALDKEFQSVITVFIKKELKDHGFWKRFIYNEVLVSELTRAFVGPRATY